MELVQVNYNADRALAGYKDSQPESSMTPPAQLGDI